ncbi:MAG: hypothetical protein ACRD63_18175 [Pyrinomonadaceae bacterium]
MAMHALRWYRSPGRENTKGAKLELHIARMLGMMVVIAHDLVSME